MVVVTRLRSKRSCPSGAASSVLLSPDLVCEVFEAFAHVTRGWGTEFQTVAAVCRVWREALVVAEQRISGWVTHSWIIPNFSKLPDEGSYHAPTKSPGPYNWELVIFPSLCRFDADADQMKSVLGTFLQVPTLACEREPSDQPPKEWARRAAVELTLHNATDPVLDRHKFFRSTLQDKCCMQSPSSRSHIYIPARSPTHS
eukprot:3037998-Prymnesium_polylepis.1